MLAAVEATGLTAATVRAVVDRNLAESALAAPAAGFSGFDRYPEVNEKAAILLQRLAGNHALPDGNKRTALLCAILFANLNGYHWLPPLNDEDDGRETAEVVEAAAASTIPLGAMRAWVGERLGPFDVPPPAGAPVDRGALVIYPAEYVGALPYEDDILHVGDLRISNVQGFNPASVYVRRISGKADGFTVAEVIISVVGDAYAQEELDAENAEAERYPLGAKEYWRGKLVGRASFAGGRVMSHDEFEKYWEEGN